jgi:hypothetical protein
MIMTNFLNSIIGQAKNPDSPFEVHDWSIKEPSPDRKEHARRCIQAGDVVVVICGEHTNAALGVAIERKIAQEESIGYFLLWGYKDKQCKKNPPRLRPATECTSGRGKTSRS